MEIIEFKPNSDELAYTFGGNSPRRVIKPGANWRNK
jgi:hypothetical protein